ncbi:MAG: hypothetical protein IKZ90_04330 [Clostridiales bacterium]|nr:hypothetical protein [Clostridiales bacterium]
MDAKRLIVTLVFAIILIGFFIWIVGVSVDDAARKNRIWREQAQKVTDASNYVNSLPFDIMYYGEDLKGPESFEVRHIYGFDQENLIGPEDVKPHEGHVIIVNDLKGDVKLSSETWKDLYNLMINDGYEIVYLGHAHLKQVQEAGFFFDVYPETTNSVIFWNYGKCRHIGFADNPKVLPGVVRESLTPEQVTVYSMIMQFKNENYLTLIPEEGESAS